jgi:hypothetical protein
MYATLDKPCFRWVTTTHGTVRPPSRAARMHRYLTFHIHEEGGGAGYGVLWIAYALPRRGAGWPRLLHITFSLRCLVSPPLTPSVQTTNTHPPASVLRARQ